MNDETLFSSFPIIAPRPFLGLSTLGAALWAVCALLIRLGAQLTPQGSDSDHFKKISRTNIF